MLRGGQPGRYVLQAAIASLYAEAPSYDQTDWPQIVTLYDRLLEVWPSPVVALNRAVPLAEVAGPAAALAEVEALAASGQLDSYQYLPAVQADCWSALGRSAEAATAYQRALDLTGTMPSASSWPNAWPRSNSPWESSVREPRNGVQVACRRGFCASGGARPCRGSAARSRRLPCRRWS